MNKLKVKWMYQMPTTHVVETTPLIIDGVMYFSEPPSNVVAVDAETGKHSGGIAERCRPKSMSVVDRSTEALRFRAIRSSLEQSTRISSPSMLVPATSFGISRWLTIRPVTALRLPH